MKGRISCFILVVRFKKISTPEYNVDVFRNASLLLLSGLGLENVEVERREEGGQRKGVRENDRRGRERRDRKRERGEGEGVQERETERQRILQQKI